MQEGGEANNSSKQEVQLAVELHVLHLYWHATQEPKFAKYEVGQTQEPLLLKVSPVKHTVQFAEWEGEHSLQLGSTQGETHFSIESTKFWIRLHQNKHEYPRSVNC